MSLSIELINKSFSNLDDAYKKISEYIPFVIVNDNKCYSNKDFNRNDSDNLLLLKFSD